MTRDKGTPITIEDKLEIRRLNRDPRYTQTDIAKKFARGRERINVICNDKKLNALDAQIIAKENKKLQETFVPRMIAIKNKLLDRLDELADTERDMGKITAAMKEFNHNIQLLSAQPTEIKREEIAAVDINKLVDQLNGNPDDVAEYLLGEKKAVDIVEVEEEEEQGVQDA